MRGKGSQKAERGLFGLVREGKHLTSTFIGATPRRFPKRSMVRSDIFVDWNSMDLMPLASNLLTSTASTQLAQLIQARLGEG